MSTTLEAWTNPADSKPTPSHIRILHRLQRLVPIEHVWTEIAGKNYPWTRVVNPDRLLEDALASGTDGCVETDPFWAATWRAAIGLDRYLSRLGPLDNLRVLELGGGSGRAGIAAGLRGANVWITDASRMALLMCRYNARFIADRVRVRKLEWSDTQAWSDRFPVILGSDIVYNPSLYPILEPCLRRSLAHNGVVLLSEPQRHTGDRFETWIRAAGWNCQSTLMDLRDGEREIRIFECRLK